MNLGHELAAAVQSRMHEVALHHSTLWLELGRITETGDLQLSTASFVIPQGSYVVAQHLLQQNDQDALVGVSISGTSVQHHHALPPLSPGTNVLVGWVDPQSPRAVVIAAV